MVIFMNGVTVKQILTLRSHNTEAQGAFDLLGSWVFGQCGNPFMHFLNKKYQNTCFQLLDKHNPLLRLLSLLLIIKQHRSDFYNFSAIAKSTTAHTARFFSLCFMEIHFKLRASKVFICVCVWIRQQQR